MSLGATNYFLRALIDRGLVYLAPKGTELNSVSVPRKRAYIYLLAPAGFVEELRVTRAFSALKQAEYRAIEQEIEALRRDWREETSG